MLCQIFKYAKKEDIIIPSDNNIVVATREHVFIATEDRKKLEEEADKKFSNGILMYGNNAKDIVLLLQTDLRFGELIG